MESEYSSFVIIYLGLVLPGAVGFFWMENWLYSKKEATRHWFYLTVQLALVTGMILSFWQKGVTGSILISALLPLSACAVGAVLGGAIGQFFPKDPKKTEPSNK